jgi:hypothetical protein
MELILDAMLVNNITETSNSLLFKSVKFENNEFLKKLANFLIKIKKPFKNKIPILAER